MNGTYVAPRRNIPKTASLCFRGSCNLRTTGIGKQRIMKSTIMSLKQDAYHIETLHF